jgi:hypothetical protein
MTERKRRHDDQRWPLAGKGKRAPRGHYAPDARRVITPPRALHLEGSCIKDEFGNSVPMATHSRNDAATLARMLAAYSEHDRLNAALRNLFDACAPCESDELTVAKRNARAALGEI